MSAKAVSYAGVCKRQAKRIPSLCVETGHHNRPFSDHPCRRCDSDAAALRALAALVERAERAVATYPHEIPNEHPFTVLLCRDLAAGYTPPEDGK